MTTRHHPATFAIRRWGYGLATLCIAATALVAGIATPAQAAPPPCDTTYTYWIHDTASYIIIPASSDPNNLTYCSMSRGSTGDGVAALQSALNRCYSESLSTDGQFGRLTEAALIRAQKRERIAATGRYANREAWSLYFVGVQGWWTICTRQQGPDLP